MKRYKAVIFDLYGTLIDELMHPEANRRIYDRKRDEMADMLKVDRKEFAREWSNASKYGWNTREDRSCHGWEC